MKQAVLISLALSFAAGSVFSPPARADAPLAFTINARLAGKLPAARVRWSFALNAAPSAATKVTINDNGVLKDAVLGGGFVSLVSGDRFRLDPATTLTNGVSVLYEARGDFVLDGDFCTLKPNPPLPASPVRPKTVNFNFVGPTITQHALGTYTVADNPGGSPFNCGRAQRRINESPAGVTSGPPTLGAALRLPLDVILVLDKSGSMGWGLPGSANAVPTRWSVLGTALDQFVTLWEQASEAGVTGDRLGLVHFDTTAAAANFGGGSMFKQRGDWVSWLAAAKAPLPGGSTGIGSGINTARDKSALDQANFDAAVILMTDGEQWEDPKVQQLAGGTDWMLAAAAAVPGSPPVVGNDELFRKGIPIQTIGFGTPASVEQGLLDGIAKQTAGTSIITATATGLTTAMQDVLLKALKGNTLGMLVRTTGQVKPPATFSVVPVQIDASVTRATFVLDWAGRSNLFDLLVQPPSGGTAFVPQVRRAGANWIIASIDVPANGPVGEWKAVVRGNDISSPTDFRLSAYAVDGRLKYSLNFGSDATGTGDAIPIMVDVSHDGKPLTAIAGGIRLSPAAPGEGAGNILHAAGPGPDPVADQSATTAKVLQLALRDQLLSRTEPKPTGEQLVLADSGSAGDTTAGDAVYTARVVDTRVPGRYRFDVALEWDDPRTGKVRRVESIERSVQAVPTAEQTIVVIAPPADGITQVKVTPRDRFGNYVGPGHGGFIKVKLNGAGTVGPVTDPAQTGDYTVVVSGVAPGSSSTLDIQVDGKAVRYELPLVPGTTGGGAPSSSGKFAIWGGAGVAIPHNSFGNTNESGPALALGFEYTLSQEMAIEATLARYRLNGKGMNANVDLTHLGVNGKWYLTTAPLRFFATAGVGAYSFDPGSTRLGGSIGAGLQYQLTSNWALEGRYALNGVANNAPQTTFSTVILALRYAF